jgi:hypothetical protein
LNASTSIVPFPIAGEFAAGASTTSCPDRSIVSNVLEKGLAGAPGAFLVSSSSSVDTETLSKGSLALSPGVGGFTDVEYTPSSIVEAESGTVGEVGGDWTRTFFVIFFGVADGSYDSEPDGTSSC